MATIPSPTRGTRALPNHPRIQPMLRECRQTTPALSWRLPDLTPQEPIHAFPTFSYQVMNYTGKGFVCIQEGEFAVDVITRLLGRNPHRRQSFCRLREALRSRQRCGRGCDKRALGISPRLPADLHLARPRALVGSFVRADLWRGCCGESSANRRAQVNGFKRG